jgi:Protein of unknown function (DUF2807).
MRNKILIVLAIATMSASLSSCYIRLSDETRKALREKKPIEIVHKGLDSIQIECNPFYKVVNRASLDTRILHTDGEPRAIVIGSTNLRDSVTVVDKDGILTIDIKGIVYNPQDERVIIYATDWLNAAVTEGSGDISIGFDYNGIMHDEACHFTDLAILNQGSGDFILGNICVDGDFNYGSMGSGDLYCNFFKAKNATITTKGSGDASIDDCNTESLTLSTYGSGDLEVAGKTQNASLKTFGSGDIDVSNLSIEKSSETKKLGSGDIEGGVVKDLKQQS